MSRHERTILRIMRAFSIVLVVGVPVLLLGVWLVFGALQGEGSCDCSCCFLCSSTDSTLSTGLSSLMFFTFNLT